MLLLLLFLCRFEGLLGFLGLSTMNPNSSLTEHLQAISILQLMIQEYLSVYLTGMRIRRSELQCKQYLKWGTIKLGMRNTQLEDYLFFDEANGYFKVRDHAQGEMMLQKQAQKKKALMTQIVAMGDTSEKPVSDLKSLNQGSSGPSQSQGFYAKRRKAVTSCLNIGASIGSIDETLQAEISKSIMQEEMPLQ